MCRSHFQATGTKFDIHIVIFDNRNHTAYQGNYYFLSFEMLILRIVRVDTHGRVTHNRFRTGSGNHCISVFSFNLVSQVKQLSMFFFINHLLVRQGCQCFRVPVNHTYSPVDKSLIIEIDKYLQHTFTALFIHSKSRTVPVTRCT